MKKNSLLLLLLSVVLCSFTFFSSCGNSITEVNETSKIEEKGSNDELLSKSVKVVRVERIVKKSGYGSCSLTVVSFNDETFIKFYDSEFSEKKVKVSENFLFVREGDELFLSRKKSGDDWNVKNLTLLEVMKK